MASLEQQERAHQPLCSPGPDKSPDALQDRAESCPAPCAVLQDFTGPHISQCWLSWPLPDTQQKVLRELAELFSASSLGPHDQASAGMEGASCLVP